MAATINGQNLGQGNSALFGGSADAESIYIPHKSLLEEYLPYELWNAAVMQAVRSPLPNVGVGAVVFDKYHRQISRGCAHKPVGGYYTSTVHAEVDAVNRGFDISNAGDIVIVALNSNRKNWTYCARPCASCARLLAKRGVASAYFAERNAEGIWSVRVESILSLAKSAKGIRDKFACKMQLPRAIA